MNYKLLIKTNNMNYLQSAKAVQEQMKTDGSFFTEFRDTPHEETINPEIEVNFMQLDLSKINESSIERYSSAFHKLDEFITKMKIDVTFPGLTESLRKYAQASCCIWPRDHPPSPKREMIQLLITIESNSKPSFQRYVIQVIGG